MIAIDSNILLRLLTQDDSAQTDKARRAVRAAEQSGDDLLINDLVLAETMWTLASRYGADKAALLSSLHGLLGSAGFAFESRSLLVEAVARFEATSAGFTDCLIAAKNVALGARSTLTSDRAMPNLPAVSLLS